MGVSDIFLAYIFSQLLGLVVYNRNLQSVKMEQHFLGALKHNAMKQLLILCACICQLCEEQNYWLSFEMAVTSSFLLCSLTSVLTLPQGEGEPCEALPMAAREGSVVGRACRTQFAVGKLQVSASVPSGWTAGWSLAGSSSTIVLILWTLGAGCSWKPSEAL